MFPFTFLYKSNTTRLTVKLEDLRKFHGGRLCLYKRGGPTYHARILRDDGGYIFRTTKRSDFSEACRVAEEWFEDVRYDIRHGRTVNVHGFEAVFRKWLEGQRHVLSSHRLTYITGTAERYLIPFFGKTSLAKMNSQAIAVYWPWRMTYWDSEEGGKKLQKAKRIKRPNKRGTACVVSFARCT